MKVGEGLEKPGKPYIVTVHAYGYTSSNFVFLPLIKNITMTLGDLRLPTGLWKSIEHMKKNECGKIWIKPGEYGFARTKNSDVIQWPELVKDNEELKNKLKTEDIFYEIELLDWIVRSDILGNGQLIKNYETVSQGYDRWGDWDDIIIDYSIIRLDDKSQKHIIDQATDENVSMMDHTKWKDIDYDSKFTFAMAKVLKSMKLDEVSNTVIQYSYLKDQDPKAIQKYELNEQDRLMIDINFK